MLRFLPRRAMRVARLTVWLGCAIGIPGLLLSLASVGLLQFGAAFDIGVGALVLSIWSFTFLVLASIGFGVIGELALRFTHWATFQALLFVHHRVFPTGPTPPGKLAQTNQLYSAGAGPSWRLPLVTSDRTPGYPCITTATRSSIPL